MRGAGTRAAIGGGAERGAGGTFEIGCGAERGAGTRFEIRVGAERGAGGRFEIRGGAVRGAGGKFEITVGAERAAGMLAVIGCAGALRAPGTGHGPWGRLGLYSCSAGRAVAGELGQAGCVTAAGHGVTHAG
jgi:hypothetical protein